jgi:hypothetical protein
MGFFDDVGDFFGDVGDFFFGSDDIEVPTSPLDNRLKQLQVQQLERSLSGGNQAQILALIDDYDVVIDDDGQFVSATPKAPTEMEQKSEQVQSLLLDQTLGALSGDLEIPSGVYSEFEDQEAILREGLLKQLGTGYETSTPGIETLGEFEQNRLETIEGMKFGRLGQLEAMNLARSGNRRSEEELLLSKLFGAQNLTLGGLSAVGNVRGYEQSSLDRAFQVAQANRKEGALGSIFSGIGTGIGAAVTGSIMRPRGT